MECNILKTPHDYAAFYLDTKWNEFLKMLPVVVEKLNYCLLLDEKYLATAEKKGKTEQQIRERKEKQKRNLADLHRYEIELEHYLKVNNDIIAGKIRPHFKEESKNGITMSVIAYYIFTMPDGDLGYFDPISLGGIVRKFR